MLKESKAKITSDTDQAVNALNGRIDFTNKDLWEQTGGNAISFRFFSLFSAFGFFCVKVGKWIFVETKRVLVNF